MPDQHDEGERLNLRHELHSIETTLRREIEALRERLASECKDRQDSAVHAYDKLLHTEQRAVEALNQVLNQTATLRNEVDERIRRAGDRAYNAVSFWSRFAAITLTVIGLGFAALVGARIEEVRREIRTDTREERAAMASLRAELRAEIVAAEERVAALEGAVRAELESAKSTVAGANTALTQITTNASNVLNNAANMQTRVDQSLLALSERFTESNQAADDRISRLDARLIGLENGLSALAAAPAQNPTDALRNVAQKPPETGATPTGASPAPHGYNAQDPESLDGAVIQARAEQALASGDREQAAQILRSSLDEKSQVNKDQFFNLGLVAESFDGNLAVELWEEGLRRTPDDYDLRRVHASGVANHLKDLDRSRQLFEQLIADRPDDTQAIAAFSGAYKFIDRYDDSLTILDAALARLDPPNAEPTIGPHDLAILYRERGSVLSLMNRDAEAIEPLARALELDPTDDVTYRTRSVVHASLAVLETNDPARRDGLYQEALDDIDRALAAIGTRNDARRASHYQLKGLILYVISRNDEAIAAYSAALQLQPWNADIRRALSDLFSARNDREKSRRVLLGQFTFENGELTFP